MKVVCPRDKFVPLFNLVSSFASTRDVRVILQNVKMTAEGEQIVLAATDGEAGARVVAPLSDGYQVLEPGEAILPAKLLTRILSETRDDEFTIETKPNGVFFSGSRSRYTLDKPDETEKFPIIAPFAETTWYKMSGQGLGALIRRTVFATDSSNVHYELRGVKFIFDQDRVTAAATDGRRLAFQSISSESISESGEAAGAEAIFPPKALNLIARAVSVADEKDAMIAIKDNEANIRIGNVFISTTLMTGQFPDWKKIVPEKSGRNQVDFNAGELFSAIRQADIVATDNKPGVHFNFSQGKVTIAAAGEATGESSIDLPIAYDGEDATLRLDSRFLIDFFKNVSGEETISFYFSTNNDYRTLFETSEGYQYVVMQLV